MNKPIKELIQRLKEPDYQYYGCELCKGEADLVISALEKQMNNGWIPVSERLPNKAGTYICTVKFEDDSSGTHPVWWHNGIRTDILWEMDGFEINAIAWQPLPEPYKEVSNAKVLER